MHLQDVSFRYRQVDVLKDITLAIPRGQMIGIIGENGSGKSTLLKLMAGLLVPTAGVITLDGDEVTRRLTHKIAYQPDIDLFYENYTGEQVFQFYKEQFDDFSRVQCFRDSLRMFRSYALACRIELGLGVPVIVRLLR